ISTPTALTLQAVVEHPRIIREHIENAEQRDRLSTEVIRRRYERRDPEAMCTHPADTNDP
ncbi:hypothetical protein, partial [Caballeronia calidae]|uniref:hypothetical protein n=1 Tax=Caballeronia calidae TaxID=1777139 RepID=UPI000AAC95A6